MFIELVEYLRCPSAHDETHLVLVPEEMVGRDVRHGSIGCPSCRSEFPIVDGIADFGDVGGSERATNLEVTLPDLRVVQALIGLASPGGYVALVGSATRFASPLAELMGGVHFVGVNPPPDVEASPVLSPVRATRSMPVRSGAMRGVVVGVEHAQAPWLEEGVRVLLNRQRLVLLRDGGDVPGTERLAVGGGLWVGEKTAVSYSS